MMQRAAAAALRSRRRGGSCWRACLYHGVYGQGSIGRAAFSGFTASRWTPRGEYRLLIHGNTVHGQQSLDPAATTRGTERTTIAPDPPGQVFAAALATHQDSRPCEHASASSAWARPSPGSAPMPNWTTPLRSPCTRSILAVVHIASNPDSGLFTFYHDCVTRCGNSPAVVLGDARLTLGRSDEKFGLLVIDAFSSDAIPIHLLTQEALQVYRRRLTEDGVLLFNISNRYLELEPVLADLARNANPQMVCLAQDDRGLTTSERRLALGGPSPRRRTHGESCAGVRRGSLLATATQRRHKRTALVDGIRPGPAGGSGVARRLLEPARHHQVAGRGVGDRTRQVLRGQGRPRMPTLSLRPLARPPLVVPPRFPLFLSRISPPSPLLPPPSPSFLPLFLPPLPTPLAAGL